MTPQFNKTTRISPSLIFILAKDSNKVKSGNSKVMETNSGLAFEYTHRIEIDATTASKDAILTALGNNETLASGPIRFVIIPKVNIAKMESGSFYRKKDNGEIEYKRTPEGAQHYHTGQSDFEKKLGPCPLHYFS